MKRLSIITIMYFLITPMVLIMYSCKQKIKTIKTVKIMSNKESIKGSDFNNWAGITERISRSEFSEIFGNELNSDSIHVNGKHFLKLTFKGKNDSTEYGAWFYDDSLFLLRIWQPKLTGDLQLFYNKWKKPEKTIENNGKPSYDEWIFASKGITLCINNAYHNEQTDKIEPAYFSMIYLYHPSDTDTYLKEISPLLTKSRHPYKKKN